MWVIPQPKWFLGASHWWNRATWKDATGVVCVCCHLPDPGQGGLQGKEDKFARGGLQGSMGEGI